MRHLNVELERLEDRIAPCGWGHCFGSGSRSGSKSSKSHSKSHSKSKSKSRSKSKSKSC